MKSLTEIVDFIMGQAPHSSTYNENGIGTILIKAGDFGFLYPNPKTFTNKPISFSKEGDILLCVVGATSGKVNLAINGSITRSLAALRPKAGIDIKYLYHILSGSYNKLNKEATGSAQGILNKSTLSRFKIPIPPLEIQKKIAAILDKADELMRNDKKILEKYDQLAQSVFLEMFGDPVTNNKNWPIKSFSYFAKIDAKMTMDFQKYSDYPHVGIGNISQNSGEIHNYKLLKEENIISGKYVFSKEHIIYSKIRPNLNKVALPTFKGLCSADAYPILVNKTTNNKYFFTYVLRSQLFIDHILKHSKRTNIPKANRKQVESFMCIAPPLELQNKFASIILKIDNQKKQTKESLQKSEELFHSLLQRAFRGELV